MVLIFCKVHSSEQRQVLAVCDRQLCGKTLKGGKLSFVVSESFYRGSEISTGQLKKKLHDFENINLIGNKAVQAAVEENLVSEENILLIGKVKHVQIFKI